MKDNQWAFKVIFQKAAVRLGRMVEFEKAKDTNLGNIDDVLSFLDRLYDKGILKVDANLPDYPFRLWTFVATNPGNDKIKVAKAVEDRIFSLLCLWYFGSRKTEIDAVKGSQILSRRKLLIFFSADKNKAEWAGCTDCYNALYKGFNTVAFYGKDHEKMNSQQKEDMLRDRFSAVLISGLPELDNPTLEQQSLEEDDE
jgi:hypothetical protein